MLCVVTVALCIPHWTDGCCLCQVAVERIIKREVPLEPEPPAAEAPAEAGEAKEAQESKEESKPAGEGAEEPAPEAPATKIVEETVIEYQTVRALQLFARLNSLPPGADANAMYFVKTKDTELPMVADNVGEVMCELVEFGAVTVDTLKALEASLAEVFRPVLEPHRGGHSMAGFEDSHSDPDYRSVGSGQGDRAGTMRTPSVAPSGKVWNGGSGATTRGGRGAGSVVGGAAGSVKQQPDGSSVMYGGTTMISAAYAGAPGRLPTVPAPYDSDKGLVNVSESIKGDFKSSMQRFGTHINHVLQQIGGDVQIVMPAVTVDDPAAAAEDFDILEALETALDEWTRCVQSVLESLAGSRKQTLHKGPLAEIEYWRQRNAMLSAVYEQLTRPQLQRMLHVLRLRDSTGLDQFEAHFSELNRKYVEAKDNVKFLTTLERHFKNISSGNLTTILDTLPSMMNALRMVWIISRHYNTDEQMQPLMHRISNEIAEKVAAEVNIKTILRRDPQEASASANEAKKVLDSWHSTYLEVRERIEQSGTDHRWEFDKKVLFDRTDYMAEICSHLLEVTTVVDEFNKFFLGPELKVITSDPRRINEITKLVSRLTRPLQNLQFNVFERKWRVKWEQEMMAFRDKVQEIERKTKEFIDHAFQRLRSAEGAFDLLEKFQQVQSRQSIKDQMMEKFDDILGQASKELAATRKLFQDNCDSPPVYKNYPPVAGAIAWARALYLKQKKPILRFRTMDKLMKRQSGEDFKKEYLEFAKDVDKYINLLYAGWADRVNTITNENLKQSLLGPKLLETPLALKDVPLPGTAPGVTVGIAAAAAAAAAAVSVSNLNVPADGDAAKMPPPPYFVNFSPALLTVIREARYLDRMGFAVPEKAMNIALQEENMLKYCQLLASMLNKYHELLTSLKPMEANLLQNQLARLRCALRPGFSPLNWNSLHILTYIEDVNKALADFETTLSQVRKSCGMLDNIVDAIQTTVLVKAEDFKDTGCLEISEFYDKLERNRVTRLDALVSRYKDIQPIMLQLEGSVCQTSTRCAPELGEFYRYWERKFFNAITTMIITSMATLHALLSGRSRTGDGGQSGGPDANGPPVRPPLCHMKVPFNPPEIVINPLLAMIYNTLGRVVRHLVESAKQFQRWMDGTCIECEVTGLGEEEEPPDFSFYRDVFQNPHIMKIMLSLYQTIYRVFSYVQKYTLWWKRYDQAYQLWNPRKPQMLDKLVDKSPSCVYFDTRLAAFSKLATTVEQQAMEKDFDFLRVDCKAVAVAIRNQAEAWKVDYGRILRTIAFTKMTALKERINAFNEGLATVPADLTTLKSVLSVIASIREAKMDIELEYVDIQERYRTLRAYDIPVDEEEFADALSLDKVWKVTVDSGLTKDMRLIQVKDEFREVTKSQVIEFVNTCKTLKSTFMSTGPTSSGMDLDQGLELVREYKERLAALNREREALVNAQKLFGLDVTRYPELQEVSEELDRASQLYEVYADQKAFAETNSNMLWVDLDISSLEAGSEELVLRMRRMPKVLRDMSTYHAISAVVSGFREGIPLIASLKNEAMKERHWNKLMDVTGVKFTMNPKTFTLNKLFEMNLAAFADQIGEIVNESMQELKIEKELRFVEEKWRSTDFALAKYSKNGEFRGWVLRSAEDIKVDLEDHMLNLQTMGGSRFVGIFQESVRKWERTLNHVSETMDVWFVVQTRWQYLEGIFSSEDIRQQLPEEARKFAAIDKVWKTIMAATQKSPNVVDACQTDSRLETLQSLSEKLDQCQKSLTLYLDGKRNAFPRFFFISDDELLSVLGTSDPTSIQVHMLKLFDNVKLLGFSRGNKTITRMESAEGEGFDVRTPAPVEGPVETWMTGVEAEMKASLHQICKEGVFHYGRTERLKWIESVLGMVSLLGSQIWWTWETEDVFRRVLDGDKYAMKKYAEKSTMQLMALVARVREPLDNLNRKKVNSLLIVEVHARDIVDKFVRDSILDAREFAWESQLRFYWDRSIDDVVVIQ